MYRSTSRNQDHGPRSRPEWWAPSKPSRRRKPKPLPTTRKPTLAETLNAKRAES